MLFQRGRITIDGSPQFSGHETFPMRYGWLKKAYDAVSNHSTNNTISDIFNSDDAIAHFGVGRNMVRAIRHWATHCDVIGNELRTGFYTKKSPTLGEKIFDSDRGLDPYMENPATLWLLHWQLTTNERLATWFSTFNLFHDTEFTRETLVNALDRLCTEHNWRRVAKSTLKRDVECFIRTYVPFQRRTDDAESFFETPLADLGLIQRDSANKHFRIHRTAKPTLGNGIFTFSVLSFWQDFTRANTLSVDMLLHQPKSPGRIFQLNEDALIEQLLLLEETTQGAVKWSETAGLKQLIRDDSKINADLLTYIDIDYK